jgi:uncharacterized protein
MVAGLAAATALAVMLPSQSADAETQEIRWGTSAVGSSGHRALVNLAATLNELQDEFEITVLPMPGAIMTVRGYALGEIEGYYGADIAFEEFATSSGRFEGFREQAEREPVQSFWTFSMETGLAIRADVQDEVREWRDLTGRRVFTGPRPWDTRANLERSMAVVGVGHEYVELDLGIVGSQLEGGQIDAFKIYTAGEADIAPWIAETELSARIVVLNPSEEEQELLQQAGLGITTVSPDVFQTDVGVDEVLLVPFYYGFHLGPEVSEEDMYRLLVLIEEHANELAQADPAFTQIAENMPEMQRRGVTSAIGDVMVHPGLARYMRERGVWDDAWDEHVVAAN